MKRNIRSFCFLALSLVAIFSLTACGRGQTPSSSSGGKVPGNTSVPANTNEIIKILKVWMVYIVSFILIM